MLWSRGPLAFVAGCSVHFWGQVVLQRPAENATTWAWSKGGRSTPVIVGSDGSERLESREQTPTGLQGALSRLRQFPLTGLLRGLKSAAYIVSVVWESVWPFVMLDAVVLLICARQVLWSLSIEIWSNCVQIAKRISKEAMHWIQVFVVPLVTGSRLATQRLCRRRNLRRQDTPQQLERGNFHERRSEVLWNPHRSLELLLPYAKLELRIERARNLVGCDLNGRSDPFLEVFINDHSSGATSHMVHMNLNPKWKFESVLEVYSPLSIVRVNVWDHDHVGSNDLIGFVEFRVADLEPNSAISGWFELRLPRAMYNSAPERFLAHALCRDDDCRNTWWLPDPEAASSRGAWLSSLPWYRQGVRHNAGEVHMFLKFDACNEPEDEWFAFCFPAPEFIYLPCMDTCDVDLGELYHTIESLGQTISDRLIPWPISVVEFLLTWRKLETSLGTIIWWYVICTWPRYFLGSIPLLVAVYLHRLRDRASQLLIQSHWRTAPLNDIGYKLVANRGRTEHMKEWIRRVLKQDGYLVQDNAKLEAFAAEAYVNKPRWTYSDLEKKLHEQRWVKKKTRCRASSSWLSHVPVSTVNWKLAHQLSKVQGYVKKGRKVVDDIIQVGERLLKPEDTKLAGLVYLGCVVATILLHSGQQITQFLIGRALYGAMLLVGTIVLTFKSPPLVSLHTFIRWYVAYAHCRAYQERREAGGYKNWAFFRHD